MVHQRGLVVEGIAVRAPGSERFFLSLAQFCWLIFSSPWGKLTGNPLWEKAPLWCGILIEL